MQNNTFDQIANANTVSMDAGCDKPVQQPRRSHIPWTVRRQIETNRIYAPTNSSICGMLFLPNSTCCVPSARVMTMQGTLIAP